MILTWYNPKNGFIYTRFYNSYIFTSYYVGYKNCYNHEVIQILIIRGKNLYNVTSYNDYVNKSSKPINENKLLTFFKMLV